MAQQDSHEMRYSFQVAYEGDDDRHSMDVQLLAPAMLALGNLVKEANAHFNGDRSSVRVLVNADMKHRCFNISFEIVQTMWDQIRGALDLEDVKSAKELLEWLELIGKISLPTVPIGLLAYLKWRKGRKVDNTTQLTDSDKRGMVRVTVGEGAEVEHIEINNTLYILGEKKEVKQSVARMLAPIDKGDYNRIEFRRDQETVNVVTRAEASDIQKTCAVVSGGIEPQIIEARLQIYSPKFDPKAPKWGFRFGGQRISADITETSMAQDVLSRGHIKTEDSWRVQLQITERMTPAGNYVNDYKVLKVLDYEPSAHQADLFPDEQQDSIEGDK